MKFLQIFFLFGKINEIVKRQFKENTFVLLVSLRLLVDVGSLEGGLFALLLLWRDVGEFDSSHRNGHPRRLEMNSNAVGLELGLERGGFSNQAVIIGPCEHNRIRHPCRIARVV